MFRKGKALKGGFLFAKYSENNLGFPRIAFVVSLKVSKKAVVRNRIKRVISEVASRSLKNIRRWDIVLVADKKIAEAPKDEIVRDIENIFGKIIR